MQVLYSRCCGLDVHKDSVVACVLIEQEPPQIRTFKTVTRDLLALRDWLAERRVSHVAMESTGVYWRPVWNVLEGNLGLLLANAQHIKNVPGHKTDVKDCQWIAQLLRHGLLRGSFVPDREQRELRDLTRQRSQLVADRARVANRIQKVLEGANLKLASVISDILGKSGRAMLQMLVEQPEASSQAVAALARGMLRRKIPRLEEAVGGKLSEHQRFMLKQLLEQVESLEKQIRAFEERIEQVMAPFAEALRRLDALPGINRRAAESILAEIGRDMGRFNSASHLASWAGLCPGNNESAGKRRNGRTRPGNSWLRQTLVQCAWAAARTKASYFHRLYERLAKRRGHKRALIAVAHAMLVTIYHLLSRGSTYVDRGAEDAQRLARRPEQAEHLLKKLAALGYHVTITPIEPAA